MIGLSLLYFLTYQPMVETVGLNWTALLSAPIILAGWYFGPIAGVGAALLANAIVTILLFRAWPENFVAQLLSIWPAYLVFLGSGYVAGLLRNNAIERARAADELHARERFLSIINITTKQIVERQEPRQVFYRLLTHLTNLFVADYAYITRWDEERQRVVLATSTKTLPNLPEELVLETEEAQVTLSALQSRRALLIENAPTSGYIVDPAPFRKLALSPKTALVIPLLAGQYKFGAVILVYETPRRFTKEEVAYADLAGNQIALALWTAQQNLQLEQKLKETLTFAQVAQLLSETERVGLDKVMQAIVDSAQNLIPGATQVVLHLLDDEQQVLVPCAVAGRGKRPAGKLKMRIGEGIAGLAISTGETIYVHDTMTDPRFLSPGKPAKFRSLIVAPIQSRDRLVGTISIQSDRPNAFALDETRLITTLGLQAAVAIENSTLLETTRRDLQEINALYHITQQLVASLDPDQLMKDVVDLLAESFGYLYVQIFTVDPDSGDLVLRQGSGQIGARLKEQGHRLPIGSGIIGHTAEIGEPFFTNNVDDVVFFLRNPLMPETQSELSVPIKIEGQVVGVLDIQQAPPARLTARDMQLMTTVADQLAVALQKANLYTNLQNALRQEQATRLQLIHSERLAVVGRLLASVSHELSNPMQAIQNALYLLKEERGISPQGRQDLEIVLSEAERMAVMLERLRAAYRPGRETNFQPVQVNDIIETVHALTATLLRHSAISFEFHPDPALPEIPALADQLRQVFLNLFVNAVDAMKTGGRLTVATRLLSEHREILVEISDTGPGIPEDILPRIFEPFVTGKEKGSGLGLFVSHEIVMRHQGRIQAENNPNGGAVFRVWLPLERGGEEA